MGIGYTCKYHGCAVPGHDACEQCMKERESLPAVETMTTEERAKELQMWLERDQLTVKWGVFIDRLAALLGRGVWTHELASSNHSALIAECGNVGQQRGIPPTASDVINSLARVMRDNQS